jgi:hypothetical protein
LTAGDAILAARELRGTLLRPTPEEEAFWSGFIARRLCDNAGVAYARLEDYVATRGSHAARTHATVGAAAAARLAAAGEGECGYAALLSVASLAALLLRCQLWRSPAPPADAARAGRRHRAAAAAAAAAQQQQRRSAVDGGTSVGHDRARAACRGAARARDNARPRVVARVNGRAGRGGHAVAAH